LLAIRLKTMVAAAISDDLLCVQACNDWIPVEGAALKAPRADEENGCGGMSRWRT
jgi:hypothetical protein